MHPEAYPAKITRENCIYGTEVSSSSSPKEKEKKEHSSPTPLLYRNKKEKENTSTTTLSEKEKEKVMRVSGPLKVVVEEVKIIFKEENDKFPLVA